MTWPNPGPDLRGVLASRDVAQQWVEVWLWVPVGEYYNSGPDPGDVYCACQRGIRMGKFG